jgi:hypothetical protein
MACLAQVADMADPLDTGRGFMQGFMTSQSVVFALSQLPTFKYGALALCLLQRSLRLQGINNSNNNTEITTSLLFSLDTKCMRLSSRSPLRPTIERIKQKLSSVNDVLDIWMN